MTCPFESVYSTFRAHKSRYRSSSAVKNIRAELICDSSLPALISVAIDSDLPPDDDVETGTDYEEPIKHKLASLFAMYAGLLTGHAISSHPLKLGM